jgi:excisionase family DNA binding protein
MIPISPNITTAYIAWYGAEGHKKYGGHMPPKKESPFYTTKELADFLKLSPRTIQRWIDEGHLPAYRFGRKFRVRGDHFDEFLDTFKAHQSKHAINTHPLTTDDEID